ncbi:class I SAM-dependent methyltransferase [Alloyangia pacifica]|uniref:Methyltransferase FkbM domain-containing protein n=1 Tax=Alloyangia pacifica TaxID=311180 RepID=A0A1I6RKH8_9RHOB|nr:class I SAM-dependent methyltransferase [Alloyangia pacifica]SDI70263.1 Methyltransferase FkbM domain-containing protein [Alloyangia pacifica]SFS65154.1 Methyltransferase FkbM domain-containing protein [Alloyangia pacifica]
MTRSQPSLDALYHYSCEFDAVGLIRSFARDDLEPTPGASTNFLGVKVPVKVFPPVLTALEGKLEGPPDPGNWHADIAEWAAALLSVVRARGSYRIVEIGCGWGCWLVNMGTAARARGLDVALIGIEGDAGHLSRAAEVLQMNGFTPGDYRLHHGIAGPRAGKAIFPDSKSETTGWGGEAIFFPDAATLARARRDPDVQVLDCMPLKALSDGAVIDLLHIDIQGAEVDFVTGSMADISSHVRRVLIGTHSRIIEGQLSAHFLEAGWIMEMERPALMPLHAGRPHIAIDGVQLWRNPDMEEVIP